MAPISFSNLPIRPLTCSSVILSILETTATAGFTTDGVTADGGGATAAAAAGATVAGGESMRALLESVSITSGVKTGSENTAGLELLIASSIAF